MAWIIESVRDAAVAPVDVFALYADPTTWSTWGHNARWARADGPLVEGGYVDVRAGYRATYHCRVRRFVRNRALELEIRPFGLFIVNVYEVEPTATGARVRHALEVSGPLAPPTRWIGLHRVYRGWLDKEVAAVIELARARAQAGAA